MARCPYINIASVPDSAWSTGDFSGAFIGTATLSPRIWDWLSNGEKRPGKRRCDLLVESLLKAMQSGRWHPRMPGSVALPLVFGLLIERDLVVVEVTAHVEGEHQLYIDVRDSGNS